MIRVARKRINSNREVLLIRHSVIHSESWLSRAAERETVVLNDSRKLFYYTNTRDNVSQMKVEEPLPENVSSCLLYLIEEVNLEDPNLSLKTVYSKNFEKFSKDWEFF